jgi:hypothetical protein
MHVPAPDRQWGPARIEPGERLACSLTGESYHPIVQALARPDCKAERLRRPPAILAQILMDLTVGTCLLGVCLVLGALGASNQIGALIAERSLLFAGTALFYGLILTSFGIGAVVTGLIRLLVG